MPNSMAPNAGHLYMDQVARFMGQPLAMAPQSFRAAASTFALMVQGGGMGAGGNEANAFIGAQDQQSKFSLTDDGIAIVPIHGTLIDRGPWLGSYCGNTSYEGLNEQLKRLAKDDGVKQVVFDINSGGGMMAGIWDILPALDALKAKKPVHAIAQNFAASAAYSIACACDTVSVTRTGHVGSVGVITQHMSIEKMLERIGLDPTLVTAGARKAQGNPFESLPDSVKADWQKRVNKSHKQFINHVAHYRGMGTKAVRETEAGLFEGAEAVEVGFADKVRNFDELLEDIRNTGGRKMTGKATAGKAAETQFDKVGFEAEIRKDERGATTERIKSILMCDEASGREAQANVLALDMDVSLEQARALLKTSPKVEAQVEVPPPVPSEQQQSQAGYEDALSRQMAQHGNQPNLGQDGVGDDASTGGGNKIVSLRDKRRARRKQNGEGR